MKHVKKPSNNLSKLSWEEIGLLCEGLSLASVPMRSATQGINDEFSLGPRGAWILRLVSHRRFYPLDLTKIFRIGRSLITVELARLTDAGLIGYEKSKADGRRVELTLTPLGKVVSKRVQQELTRFITERFASYSREELLLCSRMLCEFRSTPENDGDEPWHLLNLNKSETKKKPTLK